MASDKIVRVPIALLGIAGFVIGLVASYWVAGFFGFSPALMWSVLVILFVVGVFFLEHPKLYLYFVFFYHAVSFNGLFFGCLYVPIPFIGILDEALLAVPMAIIVMKAIHRQLPRGATFFPLLYLGLALLSWKVNHVPTLNFIRVTLSYGKFYIFWFYARAIGPWSPREKKLWFIMLLALAFLQLPFNVVWQKGLSIRLTADDSRGSIGSAHIVGYMSVIALFLLGGWLFSLKPPVPRKRVALALFMALLIAYDLIFLTDTKHVLLMVPLAAAPMFLFPRIGIRNRVLFGLAMLVFLVASWVYLSFATKSWENRPAMVMHSMKYSGKGAVFRTITRDLAGEVPLLGLLGAGPGNFCSTVGTYSMRPLANKYVLPYVLTAFRSRGQAAETSVIGSAMSSLYTLWGEFGPISMAFYFWFWFAAMRHLWRLCLQDPGFSFETGQRLGIIGGVITVFLVGMLIETFNLSMLMLPLWSLVGIHWVSGPEAPTQRKEDELALQVGSSFRMPFRF
ncbi:MAG TPA: hypothetical protein P5567_08900 [Kiritimatiellia bacterium]|nr:hypothetical protein [Kiritimatiellia bacterium]HRZ12559.1 hypothetical protein [Kiritimatiellia bacterium]HSA17637.1 hypothetical protein [Kiritimatiellia bacterium]